MLAGGLLSLVFGLDRSDTKVLSETRFLGKR